MTIDAHIHFWRYDPAEYGWIDDSMAALRRDCLPDEARREMDHAGIDACVAVQARQTLDETRWLLALADAHPFIAGVVGWVDLQADDVYGQLEEFATHSKLVGIRHIVQSEADEEGVWNHPAGEARSTMLEERCRARQGRCMTLRRPACMVIEVGRWCRRRRFACDVG